MFDTHSGEAEVPGEDECQPGSCQSDSGEGQSPAGE